MNEQNHTPEPWAAYSDGKVGWNNIMHFINSLVGDLVSYGHISREDARRIVVRVNACAGIPAEKLEGIKENTLLQTAARFLNADPIRQRDELLATLRTIASIAHCGGLSNITESDAPIAIRRSTIPYFVTGSTKEERIIAITSVTLEDLQK